jgi:hypothetical protein
MKYKGQTKPKAKPLEHLKTHHYIPSMETPANNIGYNRDGRK